MKSKLITCPQCKGNGDILLPSSEFDDSGSGTPQITTCPGCGGSGVIKG